MKLEYGQMPNVTVALPNIGGALCSTQQSLAEIGSVVWGTRTNFNGFHVFVALLHGTLVVGVSQTLRR